jgi:hypothetical protein
VSRRALAALLADEATQSSPVVGFREEILHGELLQPSAIRTWVEQQHEKDRSVGRKLARRTTAADVILFGREDKHPIFPGGTLYRLLMVAQYLERAYGWQNRAATNFVLVGNVPAIPATRSTYTKHFRYPRLSRITLEIDPSVGPRQVMEEYRRVRARFIQRRTRRIGVRSAEVVLFHLEHSKKHPSATWKEEMETWNRKHRSQPDFRFKHEKSFALYFERAASNLLTCDSKGKRSAAKRRRRDTK